MATHNNKSGIAKDFKGKNRHAPRAKPVREGHAKVRIFTDVNLPDMTNLIAFCDRMYLRHGVIVRYCLDSCNGREGWSVSYSLCGEDYEGFIYA